MRSILLSAALAAVLVCGGGCQAHQNRGTYSLPVSPAEASVILALSAGPDGAAKLREYMEGRPRVDIGGSAFDGLEVVSAGLSISVDPNTGVMTGTFTRGNDISTRAADLVKAGGDAFEKGTNAAANLAAKVGAGVATGGGSTLLDGILGAATQQANAGDPSMLNALTEKVQAARKLVKPANETPKGPPQ